MRLEIPIRSLCWKHFIVVFLTICSALTAFETLMFGKRPGWAWNSGVVG